jgi:phosphotransferase system enzyme I (PtsI)
MLIGKSASPGISIARTLVIKSEEIKIEQDHVSDAAMELSRFMKAVEQSAEQIKALQTKTLTKLGQDKAQIFEAHLMLLQDPELIEAVESKIQHNKLKSTKALNEVADSFIAIFEAMDQEYLRERVLDIKDVTSRIQRNLLGLKSIDLSSLSEPVIIVANDVTPSQMATLDLHFVEGIITEIGGKTSHTAIMARTLEVPAVVGLKQATNLMSDGDLIILDAEAGEVFTNPNSDTLRIYQAKKQELLKNKELLKKFTTLASKTLDMHEVFLEANIGTPMDLESVLRNGAQGIGLFRTEFIYMDRSVAPNENEQFEIYRQVLERMENKPVVIRTLDVGGDKNIPYLHIPKEENPFLGLRALRYCLKHQDLFKAQLRALLRASIFGNLHIMFPMVSNLEEVLVAKKILSETKNELENQGHKISTSVKVGIMIEIPSAALMANILAKHVDFFSIGTNDLIQYMCAVDRLNEQVHELYDPYNPGVLRLIAQVIHAGNAAGIEVGMCGEMASNELLTELLLGLGLTHFSMAPSSILKIRKKICSSNFKEAQKVAKEVLNIDSSTEIKKFLQLRSL